MGLWRRFRALVGDRRTLDVGSGRANPAPDGSEVEDAENEPQRSLEAQIAELRGEFAVVRLEWAEVLDKVTAWANRQAARDRVMLKQRLDAMNAEPAEERVEREARTAANGLNGDDDPPTPRNGHGAGAGAPGRLSKLERYRLRGR